MLCGDIREMSVKIIYWDMITTLFLNVGGYSMFEDVNFSLEIFQALVSWVLF